MTAKWFKAAFFVLAAAALVALLASCDSGLLGDVSTGGESGTNAGSGSAGGEDAYADVGYGPYTATGSNGTSITAQGVPEGIRIIKQDPNTNPTQIMVCVWDASVETASASYEPYHRVFYPSGGDEPEISTNNENDFIYPFTRKDAVYGVRLITWTPNAEGVWVESLSNITYVRAGGGQGDLRTILSDSGYDKESGTLWFDFKEERPAGLPGEFWYYIELTSEFGEIISYSPLLKWNRESEFTRTPDYELEPPFYYKDRITAPFRVQYGVIYWVSPDEVYRGNIILTSTKLFNAN